MKQCPECKRLYPDETLNYCLEDGAVLAEASHTEPSTEILPASEAPTRHQIGQTTTPTSRKYIPGVIGLAILLAAAGFLGYRYWSAEKQIRSIAVMPFANQSGNADLEYLSDGMTESLISGLSQLPQLKVKARSSVFRYKEKDVDPATVGKELAVDAMLTGRLIQQGSSIVLYAELVDTSTQDVLWKSDYTRPLTNLVLLQNELARDVAAKLQARLSGDDKQRLERPQTNDEDAYHLYLMGRYHLNQLTDDGFRKGAEYFRQAIAKDPKYALAYAGLADAYNRIGGFNAAPPRESFPQGRDAALKALELDNSLADAHTALGTVKLFYDWDWANAEKEFIRADELNPGYADGHFMYGLYLSVMSRFDPALKEVRLAQELDPLSLEKQTGIGDVYYNARRYDDAIREYKKAVDMDPNSGLANWSLGRSYLENGVYDEAIAYLQRSVPLSGESPDEPADLARAYARSGNKAEAAKLLNDLLQTSQSRYISPVTIGSIYAAMGENDKAFEWFERALTDRDYLLVFAKVDPMYDGVRNDPRFAKLVERIGIP